LNNKAKELDEKIDNNMPLDSLVGELDIKPIKKEMNKT